MMTRGTPRVRGDDEGRVRAVWFVHKMMGEEYMDARNAHRLLCSVFFFLCRPLLSPLQRGPIRLYIRIDSALMDCGVNLEDQRVIFFVFVRSRQPAS